MYTEINITDHLHLNIYTTYQTYQHEYEERRGGKGVGAHLEKTRSKSFLFELGDAYKIERLG